MDLLDGIVDTKRLSGGTGGQMDGWWTVCWAQEVSGSIMFEINGSHGGQNGGQRLIEWMEWWTEKAWGDKMMDKGVRGWTIGKMEGWEMIVWYWMDSQVDSFGGCAGGQVGAGGCSTREGRFFGEETDKS